MSQLCESGQIGLFVYTGKSTTIYEPTTYYKIKKL